MLFHRTNREEGVKKKKEEEGRCKWEEKKKKSMFQCRKNTSNEDNRASVSGLFNGFCQCGSELYQNKLLRHLKFLWKCFFLYRVELLAPLLCNNKAPSLNLLLSWSVSVWSLQALLVHEWVSSHNPKTSMLGYLVILNGFTCVLECVIICLCVFALWWTVMWSAYTFLPKVSWDRLHTLRWISSHGKQCIDCYNILKIFSFSQRDLRQF